MDIVDAQLHIGPGRIEETVTAMDALGIRGALIDEYWIATMKGDPAVPVAGGVLRPIQPTAELAAMTYPDRFSYLVRIERMDPEADALIRLARDAPHARALRSVPAMAPAELQAFATGDYDNLFAAVSDSGLPLFLFVPGEARSIPRYAAKFPDLRIIVDHCGIMSNSMRRSIGNEAAPVDDEAQMAAFEEVLALADYPNVALKWGHAPAMFGKPGYPGEGLWPILRKAIDRFGADRVMWASDVSANQTGETWAELLFGMRGNPDLSEAERDAFLGGALRNWIDWPADGG